MKGFGDLGPPQDVSDPTSSVYNGVEYATKELIRIAGESSNKSTKRMIVIKFLEELVFSYFHYFSNISFIKKKNVKSVIALEC